MRSILICRRRFAPRAARPPAQQPADLSQSGLVGQLETRPSSPTPAQWPKKFQEAPALADTGQGRQAAGRRRSACRSEPMVLKPLRSVGKYGGTWRRGFLGTGRQRERQPHALGDKLLFWDVDRHQDRARRRQGLGTAPTASA